MRIYHDLIQGGETGSNCPKVDKLASVNVASEDRDEVSGKDTHLRQGLSEVVQETKGTILMCSSFVVDVDRIHTFHA